MKEAARQSVNQPTGTSVYQPWASFTGGSRGEAGEGYAFATAADIDLTTPDADIAIG